MVFFGDTRIELPRLGVLRLKSALPEGDASFLEGIRSNCEAVPLACGRAPGLLLVEKCLALSAVNAVLGLPASIANGPLSRIERGILDSVLAVVFALFDFGPQLRLEEGVDCELAPGAHVVVISVDLQGVRGRVYIVGSMEFLLHAWISREPRSKAGALGPRLVLGRTRVPNTALATAETGDILVFDGYPPLVPSGSWQVWLCYANHALAARLDPNGCLCVDRSTGSARGISCGEPGGQPMGPGDASPPGNEERADVAAEIGQLEPRVLVEFFCGVPLSVSRAEPILLRVGVAPWAEGELVERDGSLAVRITRELPA